MSNQQIKNSNSRKTQRIKRTKPYCQCDPNCLRKPVGNHSFCPYHAKKGCPIESPMSGSEPKYNPAEYNADPNMTDSHNCFAYAFGIKEPPPSTACENGRCNIPFHQPGSYAGYPRFRDKRDKSCPDMMSRILGDMPNVKLTDFKSKCPAGTSKVAFVVDPKRDYHFYRQDKNGLWSDKHGAMPVTNYDADGKLMYNPALANRDYKTTNPRLNYKHFCGFICVPRDKTLRAKRGGSRKNTRKHSRKSARKSTRKSTRKNK